MPLTHSFKERKMLSPEEKRMRQREADARYRKNHPEKSKEKSRKRYWADRENQIALNAEYHKRNKTKVNLRVRNRHHRITQEWFDSKLVEQNNRCALCYEEFKKTPHVDHDHRCCPLCRSCDECRRDLLCTDCNLGLGRFKDNIETLERAIQYLRRHNNGLVSKSGVQAT